MRKNAEARDALYPANARSDRGFGNYLEEAEFACIIDMGAAAKLGGEVARSDDSDDVAVFLAEESHCAELLRLGYRHLNACNGQSGENNFVDSLLNIMLLLGGEGREVSEIESDLIELTS